MIRSSNDPILFAFADIKRLFIRHLTSIKRATLIGGLLAFLFLLFSPTTYKSEASFKQSGKQKDFPVQMKEVFQQLVEYPSESGAIVVIQSNEVIQRAVEELGMQVKCDFGFFPFNAFKRALNNFHTEFGGCPSDPERFVFREVKYSGEKKLKLYLKLTNSGSYQLYDASKKYLGEAVLGNRVVFPAGELKLNHAPKDLRTDKLYSLTLMPMLTTIHRLRSELKIFPHRLDKSVLKLTFSNTDRRLSAEFLNCLMKNYQTFLKSENDAICQNQLEYLQKRQDELIGVYDRALIEHAAFLNQNVAKNGFVGFSQEIETLTAPKKFYTSKLFDIDLELKRIADCNPRVDWISDPSVESFQKKRDPSHFRKISDVGASSRRQETIELHEQSENDVDGKRSCDFIAMQLSNSEILELDDQIREASLLLQSIEKDESIPPTPSLLKKPKSAIAQLVKQIKKDVCENRCDNKDWIPYIRQFVGQLQQKRRTLEEDLALQEGGADEFSGLSIATAQSLLAEYTRQRDSLQAQMRELVFLREQLGRPDFEISSLAGAVDDPVTKEIVNQASTIALQLKDEYNRSIKEHERLIESLQTKKNFLSHYLFQIIELKRLRLSLLGDKVASLQKATFALLQAEKELLNNKLEELNVKMGSLSDKWRRESLLLLKQELGMMMLQGISQLVETKALGQHTFQTDARPLDRAVAPLKPQFPGIFLISFVSAVLTAACYFFIIFCKALFKGLPATDASLKLCGFPVSGKVSKYCNARLSMLSDGDLETLRYTVELLVSRYREGQGLTALSMGGKYTDFSSPLAELLALRGLKVVVVQCVFDAIVHADQIPGLWQYLHAEVKDIPIRRHLTYDLIPCGGTSRHGSEIVCSPLFQGLLTKLKNDYDIVLVQSSAEPSKMGGVSLLKIADALIITFQQETKEDLEIYWQWADRTEHTSVTFVYAEEFV